MPIATLVKDLLVPRGGLTQTHYLMSVFQIIFGMPKALWMKHTIVKIVSTFLTNSVFKQTCVYEDILYNL